jgi:predicted NBD/HSP70 family sugar kinase
MMTKDVEMRQPVLGLIEAGGTKFVLGVARADGTILARHRVATTRPDETILSLAWFEAQREALGVSAYAAFGLASFGPIELDRASPNWGVIGATTKPHWEGTDLCGPFARAFDCPVALETDVNGAALAEGRWGAGKGHGSLLYLTIGTGVGADWSPMAMCCTASATRKWAISTCRAIPMMAALRAIAASMAPASKGWWRGRRCWRAGVRT